MGKVIISILVIFIVFIALVIGVFIQKEPANIQLSIKNCFGGKICWIGQTISLGINFKINNDKLNGVNKSLMIRSVDGGIITQNIVVGNESNVKIPIGVSLSEGDYKLMVSSELIDTNNVFLTIKRWITGLFGENEYKASQEITLKYPIVKVEDVGYKCNQRSFYFDEIKLKLEDPYVDQLNCKLRIYVDTTFVHTNHELLTKNPGSPYVDYYENKYSQINKKDLTGSIQKVTFVVENAVQQTNTRLVPVCLIENNDVEIRNQEINLKKCEVNQ